jgi:hypothetical protein
MISKKLLHGRILIGSAAGFQDSPVTLLIRMKTYLLEIALFLMALSASCAQIGTRSGDEIGMSQFFV